MISDLNSFINATRNSNKHIIVESNALAKLNTSDIIIFIDGIEGKTDFRNDMEKLREVADIKICHNANLAGWKKVLSAKIDSKTICDAVCNLMLTQKCWNMEQGSEIPGSLKQAISSTEIFRIPTKGLTKKLTDHMVVEQAITIMVDKVGSFTVMATPSDIEALAIGFIYSEGLIDSINDVVSVTVKPQLPNVIGIQVHDPTQISIRRNMIVASSCGMCGARNIDKILSEMPVCNMSLDVSSDLLIDVAEHLKSMQQIFKITGGSHAAGIFNHSGKIIAFAEDLGRHNALDKAIGKCLLDKLPMKGCAAILSGRVSLEMVTKTARAGLELIAAVSAVSSFAVEAAERWNITLCGFVRPDKINIYTHPKRINNLKTDCQNIPEK